MVQRGMELLSEQEANNRLATVGQPDADLIARLFNTLISKLHEERLRSREQNKFLQQLIEASPMGIALLDYNDNFVHVNPSFLKLARLSDKIDIRQKNLYQLSGYVVSQIQEMKQGEIKTIKCDNQTVLRCYLLYFMERGFRRPFILLESLTDEILDAERKAYGKVIRIMAHEVNNSMTGITTLLDILSAYHCDDSEMSEFITSVIERCNSMGRFIGAYADVVRLPEPLPEQLDVKSFIQSQLPFIRSISPYPIELNVIDDPIVIHADADMLSQVLVNIIKNSTEAIRKTERNDGRIIISACKDKHAENIITISDNGCGIASEIGSELFNPFFTTKPDGQGIGLTMVAEILRKHNAGFSLLTDNDGITRFRIRFS
ncbi:MAG: PAS domain-containing protein [Muribaculaceae bacterium]|nr:PAS domain-containing protein [Muribaculaceae bacterium]